MCVCVCVCVRVYVCDNIGRLLSMGQALLFDFCVREHFWTIAVCDCSYVSAVWLVQRSVHVLALLVDCHVRGSVLCVCV